MENLNTMTDRTCEILDYIYKTKKPSGISNIAQALDLPKATVFRILVTLEKWGFVQKDDITDTYKLGIGMIKYGSKISSEMTLVDIARPLIDQLSVKIGESVNLNIQYNDQSLSIYKSPNDSFVLVLRLAPISELNCSSSGKIFLANKSEEEIKEYFENRVYLKRTINSIITYSEFLKEKESIEKNQIAFDDEEYEYGLFCLASPIFHDEKIVAAVSISGPKTRLQHKGFDIMEKELKKTCSSITELIENLDINNLF